MGHHSDSKTYKQEFFDREYSAKEAYGRLWGYTRKYRFRICFGVLCGMLTAGTLLPLFQVIQPALDKVPYVDVPKVIAAHDVVLGVFGTTAKAARVIGNKVYECMACCRPTVNEFCTGYPPEAKDCPAIKFIPAGDPDALVQAVEAYRADWARRDAYFAVARAFFEKHLSMQVIKGQLAGILADMGL